MKENFILNLSMEEVKSGILLKPATDFGGYGIVLDFSEPINYHGLAPAIFPRNTYSTEELYDILKDHFHDFVKELQKSHWTFLAHHLLSPAAILKVEEQRSYHILKEVLPHTALDPLLFVEGTSEAVQQWFTKLFRKLRLRFTEVPAGEELYGVRLMDHGMICASTRNVLKEVIPSKTTYQKCVLPDSLRLIDLTGSQNEDAIFFGALSSAISLGKSPFNEKYRAYLHKMPSEHVVLELLNRFVLGVHGMLLLKTMHGEMNHVLYVGRISFDFPWQAASSVISYDSLRQNPHQLAQERKMFGAEEIENLTYIAGSLKWEQSSCWVSAVIVLMAFLKSNFYRNNVFEFDPFAYEYKEIYQCSKTSAMNNIINDKGKMDKFRAFVAEVEDSLNVTVTKIKNKQHATCTLTRATIDLCLDSLMADNKYSVVTPNQWVTVFNRVLPNRSRDSLMFAAVSLRDALRTRETALLENKKNPSLIVTSDSLNLEPIILKVLKVPYNNFNAKEVDALYEATRRYISSLKAGMVGDPVDLYDFFGAIFPNIQMEYSFKNDPRKIIHRSATLEASLYFCNTNSSTVVASASLAQNDMLVFSNRFMRELVWVTDGNSEINRPLNTEMVIQASETFDYPIIYYLQGIIWLVVSDPSKPVTGDDSNHYAATFRGKDHWYYFSNARLRNKMKIIQVSRNHEEQLRKLMYRGKDHKPILYFYARKYTKKAF